VIVSARKREENLQDVPISITALNGEDVKKLGLQRFDYIGPSIPNFSFSYSPTGNDELRIRGISPGTNFGFETAAGLVIDGFFYGKTKLGRAAFLDLDRIEVLKGPQGAILGKNNSSGALMITTRRPTDEFQASITATVNYEGDEGYDLEGAISGPITDRLRARLAARRDDYRGMWYNFALNEHEQSMDDLTARGTLEFDASDDLLLTLSYQKVHFNRKGTNRELFSCGPVNAGWLASAPYPADCTLDWRKAQIGPINGVAVQDRNEQDLDLVHFSAKWDLSADLSLTALTGFMRYETLDAFDGDNQPSTVSNVYVFAPEKYSQLLQEIRLQKASDERWNYTLGLFFLRTNQTSTLKFDFAAPPPAQRRVTYSDQDGETIAAFAEVSYDITKTVEATLGGRFTYESKDLVQDAFGATVYTDDRVSFATGPARNVHFITPSRSEREFSPTLDVVWRPTENRSLYGSIRRGFRGGGYDMFNSAPQATVLNMVEFDAEKVTAYEMGAKQTLLDNTMRLNVSVFRSNYSNLQLNSYDPELNTFFTKNAAEMHTQGVEVGFEWQPLTGLLLSADVGTLYASFDSFPNAQCYQNQTTGCDRSSGVGLQDLTGKRRGGDPDYNGSVSARYTWLLGADLMLTGFGQVSFSGSQYDQNPILRRPSYELYNARLALANGRDTWEVALIGRNLTNELIVAGTAGVSPDALDAHLHPPRVLGVQGTLKF
jgi:outer membrane receptor protein involved in Fe transport